MKLTFLTLILAFVCPALLHASDVNLTADEKVEWHQKEQKIVAVGNAVATKDKMNIRADRLVGHYADRSTTPKGKSQITKVDAFGNVIMKSPNADAYGSTMNYDLIQDVAVLKGKPAKIATAKEIITAEDNITYYPSQQKAVAFGNVMATDKENKLYADKMVAYFVKENETSSNIVLDKVNVYDHVKIVTPNTIVNADRGVYHPQTGKVKLFDNITINQDGNILHGDQAETDLNSGISKLISTKKSGKVKGVFKEKKKETTSPNKQKSVKNDQ